MAMVQIPFSKHVFYVLRPYRNFYCFFMLRVRLFCQIHGLTVFPNKHMVNWRSYSGLPCVSDRVKTVSRFLLFLALRVRLFCQIHGLTVFPNKHMVNWRSYSGLLHVLVREKTVYLWACSADENYNLDSDEILWVFDCQV